jgi:hypothetical protein
MTDEELGNSDKALAASLEGEEAGKDDLAKGPYRMEIDMRVLDHLGIHLYSNAAAVLSEAVANAWDALAENVTISMSNDVIEIQDDGIGMNLETINDRFLYVGYDKRKAEGERSQPPKERLFMGRKGIGKLSLFSIADNVTVHTRRGDERHAFQMLTSDIQGTWNTGGAYVPKPVEFDGPLKGTRIVLCGLKTRRVGITESALRKRIARRFSVIGLKTERGDTFNVQINGKAITHEDRDDLKNIEFLWELGSERINTAVECPKLKLKEVHPSIVDDGKGWIVKGWIGAAARPMDLRADDAGSMNGLVVVARGRLIQENILDRLDFNKIFANYVTGQIEADFLDMQGWDDIATSDRQRLIEDDDRYMALIKYLREMMYTISEKWVTNRNLERAKDAIAKQPKLQEWIDQLPEGQRQPAQKMIGLIEGVEMEKEADRLELYRSGVLAFERLKLRDETSKLSNLKEMTAEALLPLVGDLQALEGSMYRDIIRERIAVIAQFKKLVDDDAKEKVLQETLFRNMWLLDAGWERATEDPTMEQTLKTEYKEFADGLDEEKSKGRIDIRYRRNAGEHIIVELKRSKRVISIGELMDQGEKYRTALIECVQKAYNLPTPPHVELVFVLGEKVRADAEVVQKSLSALNARVMYYQEMIRDSEAAYAAFLERTEKADAIDAVVKSL